MTEGKWDHYRAGGRACALKDYERKDVDRVFVRRFRKRSGGVLREGDDEREGEDEDEDENEGDDDAGGEYGSDVSHFGEVVHYRVWVID